MKKTDTRERIIEALTSANLPADKLRDILDIERRNLNHHLSILRKTKKIYVCGYLPAAGNYILVYAVGDSDDAVRPKKTREQTRKDYYEKLKADKERYKKVLKNNREKKRFEKYGDAPRNGINLGFDPVTFWVPRKQREEIC